MKKKIFSFLAIIIVLSVFLAGCNMFVVNAERDGDQVVATVEYQAKDRENKDVTLTSDITKTEYLEFFQNNFQMFASYYGYTAVEAGPIILSMLAKQKTLVLMAVEEYAKTSTTSAGEYVDLHSLPRANYDGKNQEDYTKEKNNYDKAYASFILDLLRPDEQKYVYETVNKMFEDSFDSLVQKAEEQDRVSNKKDEDKKDKDKEETLKPRPVQPDKEDHSYKKDDSITIENVDKTDFFTKKDKEFEDFDKQANHTEEELKTNKFERDAVKQLKKNMENQYRNYDFYLAKQAESRLVEKYTEDKSVYTGDIDVQAQYDILLADQQKLYKDAAAYKSAYEGSSDPIIFHNGKYVKVKSILLKFNEEQTKYLEKVASKYKGEQYKDLITMIRFNMVFGVNADMPFPIPEDLKEDLMGLKVKVSNKDWKEGDDPEKAYITEVVKETNEDGTEVEKTVVKEYDFLAVIDGIAKAVNQAGIDAESSYATEYKVENTQAFEVGKKMYIANKKIEKFNDLIFLVNDDDGMFQGKDYVETPYEQDSSYVVEYTALVRALLMQDGAKPGDMAMNTVGDQLVAGDQNVPNVFVSKAKVHNESVDIYTYVNPDNSEAKMSFIINQFGVHIVMLTDVPFNTEYNQVNVGFTKSVNTEIDYEKIYGDNYDEATLNIIKDVTSFYTYTIDGYVAFDKETGKALTVRDTLVEKERDRFEKEQYTRYESDKFFFFGENVFDSSDDKADKKDQAVPAKYTLNKSVYSSINSIFKDIDKQMSQQ